MERQAELSTKMMDYCFFDFETRAYDDANEIEGDVARAGTYRYAKNAYPIILTYAIGDAPVKCIDCFYDDGSGWAIVPEELDRFWERARDGEAWFVAWKTSFDRAIWNNHLGVMTPEMAIDAMCQAMASNLPSDLQNASTALGGPGKQSDGKKLIKLFTPPNGATPESHPAEWERFKTYAVQDTEVLRDVFRATRKLSRREWEEYWAAERINERGVMVDTAFCDKADMLSKDGIGWANRQLFKLTGKGIKVSNPRAIALWVHDNLKDPLARAILEEELPQEDDETVDDDAAPANSGGEFKLRLTKAHILKLRQYLAVKAARSDGLDAMDTAIDKVLELREYGGATSVAKFAKMRDQADDKRLKDSYVFNGGSQTGRFSSRGIQIHNLPRDSLGALEEVAIESINGMEATPDFSRYLDAFAAAYGPIGKAMSKLIRPALVAPVGRTLVWGDWSNIEARVNPWLSNSRSGAAKLKVFRHADAHPDEPDVYCHTASDLLHIAPEDVTKAQRQSHGKVPELSLGFGGSEGALLRMAATYGVAVSDEDAKTMVAQWREANPWASRQWQTLWTAILNAMEAPNSIVEAGRVAYIYVPDYMRGTLFCALPCGRILSYPKIRWTDQEVVNEDGTVYTRKALSYAKGRGRAFLWYGKACENITQATAGSLMRAKLVELKPSDLNVVLHTHDDICCEVDERHVDAVKGVLAAVMKGTEDWCRDLPLAAEVSSNWYFTKHAE